MQLAAEVAPAPASASEALQGTSQVVGAQPSQSAAATAGAAAGNATVAHHKAQDVVSSHGSSHRSSKRRALLHASVLVMGLLLLALLTATAAARPGLYRRMSASANSSDNQGTTGVGDWWGRAPISTGGHVQATAVRSRQVPFSRHLLQTQWGLLGLRTNRLSGGILQQLLTAATEEDTAAANAAKEAASAQGRASRLLLTDLDPSTGGEGPPRVLATAAQGPSGPVGTAGQALLPIGTDAQPLCSATINYGASVGDASKKATADVPIYVGSFDIVVTQPQNFQPETPLPEGQSRWVLGWQFAAGEYLQMTRDVFGDDGIQRVFMSPSLQPPPEGTEAASALLPNKGNLGQAGNLGQRVAVFSNTSLGGSNAEVVFSFVGRKGPERPILPSAPFRVAPPERIFLNNHYCWPFFKPQGSGGSSPAAVAAAVGSGAAVGLGSSTPAAGQPDQQVQMVEVATPKLEPDNMPKQLQVEYLPVEFASKGDDPALFAKTVTQFYFKITNLGTAHVPLEEVLLQYWFHGPLDGTATAPDNSSAAQAAGVTSELQAQAARVSASQFRLTCSDASPQIGCGGLAWNVTPGLPSAFGARYVLNVWFPSAVSNSSDNMQPFALLPTGNNSTSGNSIAGQQGLTDMQAIVAIEPRRFFANISATNDYSFSDTPVLGPQPGANSSSGGDGGQLVRRRREPNPRMPAYIADQLAWGSPPVGGRLEPRIASGNSTAGNRSTYPPGSYCQPSPGGGLVCGIDVLYCCLGSGPLNLAAVPPDWPNRLASGTNPAIAPNDTVGNPTEGLGAAGDLNSSGNKSGLDTWAVALAVVLPIVAVIAAAVGGGTAYVRRRRRSSAAAALQFKPFNDSSNNGSTDGGDVLTELQRPPGPGGLQRPAGWAAVGGVGTAGGSSNPSLLAALLSPHSSQGASTAGWSSAGMQQQQLAEWQLTHAQQVPDMASSHRSESPPQVHYSTAMSAAAAAANPQQQQLVRVLKPKVPSLPGDMIAAVAKFAKQQHLRQQSSSSRSSGNQDRPGSPFASASCVPFAGAAGLSQAVEVVDGQDGRCHTWTGRLHEDAFEDDVLDQLFNMHMRPQLMHAATPGSPPATTDKVWHQLQQQQHPLSLNNGAGAAAAAVEAAVAAINALLSGTVGLPRQPSPALSKYPPGRGRGSNASSGSGTRPNSPGQMVERSGSSSSPSFYKALMATGGVLRPPGGPPIPLNVDYAAEIQPNLGRLLGRGGFGHVYEATWRGQKVAVKLLTVDTEDPAVLDAFLKEVALCACLRGCDRVVRLLGACLGGCGTPPHANQSHPPHSKAGGATVAGSSFQTSSTTSMSAAAAASVSLDNPSVDMTPFQSQLPPDVAADDTPPGSNAGGQQQQQQQWALIMELVEGGNLAHRIYHPSKRSLSYLEILQVGLDIASGLAYLHPAVVHRDLKPQNVLLDKHGRAKIADFGISRFKDPHRSYLSVTHQGGTPNYMAPELFNASRVDEAADVYSLGCILYECLAKQQPFGHLADEGKSFNVLFKIIVAVAINKERPPLPHDTPPRLAALILRCWCENPAGRPHVHQLLAELEDMMKEALQERAERTGKLARINSISSRSHSLPTQSLHHRKDSTGSIISNASSANGSSSPIRPGHAVRAALTLPMPGPPHNSLASSLAAVSDGSASFGMWPLPATGSGSYHGSGLPKHNGSGTALAVPGGVVPLPSIGAAIAARASARAPGSGRRSSDDTSTTPAAASDVSQGFSLQLQTGAAARLPAYAAGQGSSDSGVDGTDLPSPRPFQDQQLLTLQQEQEQQQQQQQFAHQQQQQLLGPCTSLASSMYSRRHWQCPCFGSPEPCAACAGSTSSSDGGSSNGGGCGSSGGSHRTPSSTSPLHMSPTGGRQLSLLPQIPQDMPALPAEDDSAPSAAATAGGEAVVDKYAAAAAAAATGMQMSSLHPPLLRSKASIASPQTPARNAHVGRKPSHLSSHASGALFSSEGSIPIGVGALAAHHQQQQQQLAAPGSSDYMYAPPAAAATAYSALLYPLHTDNIAAATAAALGSQPVAMLQRDAGVGGSSGSYNHGVATLASATPAAAAGLSGQRSVGHSRSSSSTSSNGSAGSVVLKRLHTSHPDTAANTTVAATVPEVDAEQQGQHSEQERLQRLQQQRQSSMQQHDSRRYSSSLLQRRAHDQSQQQQQRAGLVRPSTSLPPSLARSTSSVPSEAPQAGELSSSQSSSPSAVTASVAAASVYSCSSGTSRLRSASLDFGSTSLYINPLFGLAADAWQPPQLQMQHSAPSVGRAGSASSRSAALLAIGQAAPVAEAAAAALQTGSQHHLRESVESGSDNTMFVTAKSYAASAAAGSVDLGPGPAAGSIGDFSLHGTASVTSSSRMACVCSDTAAAGGQADQQVAAKVSGSGHLSTRGGAAAGAAGACTAAVAAAGDHAGDGVAVARKVSFADTDEVLGC